MSLPRIKLDDSDFNNLVFSALKEKRGFILANLSGLTPTVNNLCTAFDDFLKQPESFKKSFQGDVENGANGFFPKENYKTGSIISDRFFFKCEGTSHTLNHAMPKPIKSNIGLEQANAEILAYTRPIIEKISQAIETGLNLEKGKLTEYIDINPTLTLSHFYPMTQEKMKTIFENSQLTITKFNEIKTFIEHRDLSLFTLLIYRKNHVNGLSVKIPKEDGKAYEQVQLDGEDDLCIIVITGRVLKEITNKMLKGLMHNVNTTPLKEEEIFYRDAIALFVVPPPALELKPLINKNGAQQKNYETYNQFYMRYHTQYQEGIKNTALKELPSQIAEYPTENEIITLETEHGPAYKRISLK